MAREINGVKIPIEYNVKRLEATATEAKKNLVGLRQYITKQLGGLANELRDFFGNRLVQILSVATITHQIKQAVDAAAQFELALKGVMAAAGGAGEDMLKARDAAVQLSADGFMSVTQAAQALTHLLRTGFTLDQAVQIVQIAKNLAAFGSTTGDAGQAVVDFARGLRSGSIALMENAGWTTRLSQVLGDQINLAGSAEQRAQFLAAAWEENARVAGLAGQRIETMAGSISLASSKIEEARVKFGLGLRPFVEALPSIAGAFARVMEWLERFGVRVAYVFLSTPEVVKAAASGVHAALGWLGRRFAEFAGNMIAISRRVPLLGRLIGIIDDAFVGDIIEGINEWGDAVVEESTKAINRALTNIQNLYAALDEIDKEIKKRYADPASAITPPRVKLERTSVSLPQPRIDLATAPLNVVAIEQAQLSALGKSWAEVHELGINIFKRLSDEAIAFSDTIADSVITTFEGFARAIEDAFAAMASGSGSAAKAFSRAMLAALASVARAFGQFFMGRAVAAIGEGFLPGGQIAWAAAAKFSAAAATMFALAGALGGLGGSNIGLGPSEAAHGFERASQADRGQITLVFPEGIVDFSDPDWQRRLVDGLNAAGKNNYVINIRNRNG